VGQRAAEQLHRAGVDQADFDLGADRTLVASAARSRQLASQWCIPSMQYGSSSWAFTTGVTPSVIWGRRSSSAKVRSTRINGR
jgi:hypothetical protein